MTTTGAAGAALLKFLGMEPGSRPQGVQRLGDGVDLKLCDVRAKEWNRRWHASVTVAARPVYFASDKVYRRKPPASMSDSSPPSSAKPGQYQAFLRACRFLGPHRRIVIVSILCAFVVGAAFTGTLGSMLPVFNILLSGRTVDDWASRLIVEKRLEVRLSEDQEPPRLLRVNPGGAADRAGLRQGDSLELRARGSTLRALADATGPVAIEAKSQSLRLELPAVPWHLRLLRGLARPMPAHPVKAIAIVLGVIVGLTIFQNVVRFFQEYFSEKAAVLAIRDIRRKLYDHVLRLPMSYFSLRGTSDATSRLTQESQTLQDGLKTVLGQSIQEPIKAGFAFALALAVSWKLTLFICVFAPLAVVVIRKFGKKMRRASRAALQNSAAMLGQVESSLGGVRVVKASQTERFERRSYTQILKELVGRQLHMARIDAMNTPVLETVNLMVVCAVVLYAAYLVVVTHTLTPGHFLLVMACLIGIGESLRRIGKVNNVLQRSNAAAGRIFEVLDVPTERQENLAGKRRGPAHALPALQRDIVFEDVSFTYPGAAAPAVRHVSLQVPRGRCVAVVGRNGSGKTTLLALLPRFYDPQQGRILLDGIDIRSATLSSLRRQISIVTQDSVIFPGTIAHNIAYGSPLATAAQIESAARRAFAHEFILEKPQGYQTAIGEHGASLSGGQKQRLCIARAILRQTPILILDEATSQVDAESEHLIQQAIESLVHERTTFVIAHRFSTILAADHIVVMERGQIIDQGRHEQLLGSCAIYQQLYDRQLAGAASAL